MTDLKQAKEKIEADIIASEDAISSYKKFIKQAKIDISVLHPSV